MRRCLTVALAAVVMTALPARGNDQLKIVGDWESRDGKHLLAFRSLTRDGSEGVVWYSKEDKETQFYSGTYKFRAKSRVTVSLTRSWKSYSMHGDPWWALGSRYKGGEDNNHRLYSIDLELDWNVGGFVATALSPKWIDSFGRQYSGEVHRLAASRHIPVGAVIEMKRSEVPASITDNPPPGFVAQTKWAMRAAEKPGTIYNTSVLNADLFGWAYDDGPNDDFVWKYCVISLTAGEKWSKGNAWLINAEARPEGLYFEATKGLFSVYTDKFPSQDVLRVALAGTRLYRGKESAGQVTWEMVNNVTHAALNLEIPLEDHLIPNSFHMYVQSLDYVNAAGEKIAKREFNGLFEPPERVYPTRYAGIRDGYTIRLQAGNPFSGRPYTSRTEPSVIRLLENSPPPGFRLRDRSTPHVAAKPAEPKPAGASENPLDALWKRGQEHQAAGRYAAALEDYEELCRRSPSFAPAFNSAAWLMATCPEDRVRNGRRAIELAKKACELTDHKQAYILDTLAAAYAETGDFETAIRWQREALKLADGDVRPVILEHLVSFYEKKPIREK